MYNHVYQVSRQSIHPLWSTDLVLLLTHHLGRAISPAALAKLKLSIPLGSQLSLCLGHSRASPWRPCRGCYWLGICLASQDQ